MLVAAMRMSYNLLCYMRHEVPLSKAELTHLWLLPATVIPLHVSTARMGSMDAARMLFILAADTCTGSKAALDHPSVISKPHSSDIQTNSSDRLHTTKVCRPYSNLFNYLLCCRRLSTHGWAHLRY